MIIFGDHQAIALTVRFMKKMVLSSKRSIKLLTDG